MLDVAQIGIFWLFASGVVAVVDGDVAASVGSSGLDKGGWEGGWCAVDWPGIQCCHSVAAGSGFGARDRVVVVVDDVVGVIDGSCAALLGVMWQWCWGVCVAFSLVLGLFWVL